jgi:hypothetical protein
MDFAVLARGQSRTAARLPKRPLSRSSPVSSGGFRPSRRQFVRNTAGAVVAGATLGGVVWPSHTVTAQSPADPRPIPGGTADLGGAFHVYGPGFPGGGDGPDAEPSSITNFNGFVGLAFISGTVRRTQVSTGAAVDLPYLFNDMRFMQGVYRGFDGRARRGTFGFI